VTGVDLMLSLGRPNLKKTKRRGNKKVIDFGGSMLWKMGATAGGAMSLGVSFTKSQSLGS